MQNGTSKGKIKQSLYGIIKWPVATLAKPIDRLLDRISEHKAEKQRENNAIAENSELYSDFSVEAAKHNETGFKEHVAVFRSNSLSLFESLYNAVVIKVTEKAKKNNSDNFKKNYRDIPAHPMGWEDEQNLIHKPNVWDTVLDVLGIFPKLVGFFSESGSKIKANIRKIIKVSAAAALVLACTSVVVFYVYDALSEDVQIYVSLDGSELGYIQSKSVIDEAVAYTNTYMNAKTGEDYSFAHKIDYSLVHTHENTFISEEQLSAKFIDIAKAEYVSAYVLYIDDKRIAANASYSGLSSVISSLESAKTRQFGLDGAQVKISNSVRIENMLCRPEELCSAYDIYLMLGGYEDIIFYQNQTAKSESESADVSVIMDPLAQNAGDDIESTGEDTEKIELSLMSNDGGDIIPGNDIDVGLVFSAVVREEMTEEIPYETVYEYSESYTVGTMATVTEGQNGILLRKYDVSYVNGKEVSRTLVSSEYVSEPVNEVVYIGVGNAPPKEAVGSFIYPLSGRINIVSHFGDYRRNTGYHYGIDMADSYGTPIFASDSGTVTFAKWEKGSYSSYGNLVIIDHGNGFETYYAHMQEILVSEGDTVYQGQIIGKVGSTGEASGSHLHFEVHYDGKRYNPLECLPDTEQ